MLRKIFGHYYVAVYLVTVDFLSLATTTDVPANVALDILRGRVGEYTAAEVGNLTATAIPGISYPNITRLPDNVSFRCANVHQTGYYADPGYGCQVYYRCELNSPLYIYLCPVGKLFNQIILNCDWFYNVQCDRSPQFYDYSNPRLYLGPNVTFLQNANDGNVTSSPTAASVLPGFVSSPTFDTAESRSLLKFIPDIKDPAANFQKSLPMYTSGSNNVAPGAGSLTQLPQPPPQPQQLNLDISQRVKNSVPQHNLGLSNIPRTGQHQSITGLFNSKTLRRPNSNIQNKQMRYTKSPPSIGVPTQLAHLPFTSTPQSSFKSIHPPSPQQSSSFTQTSLPGGDLLTRNRLLFSQPSQRTRTSLTNTEHEDLRRLILNDKMVTTMSSAVQVEQVTPFPFHQSAVPTEVFIPTLPATFTRNPPSNFQLMSDPQSLNSFNRQDFNPQSPQNPNIISQIFDPRNRNDAVPDSYNPSANQQYQTDGRMGDWVLPNSDFSFLPTDEPSKPNRPLTIHSDFLNTWIPFTDPQLTETTTLFSRSSHIEEERLPTSTRGYFTASHQDDLGQVAQPVQLDDDYRPALGMFRLFSGEVTRPVDTRVNQINSPTQVDSLRYEAEEKTQTQQDNGLFQRLQFAHSNSSDDSFLADPSTNY